MTRSGNGRSAAHGRSAARGFALLLLSLVLPGLLPGSASAAAEPARIAYVDPGAGSLLLQAVLATLAGVVVVLHGYWKKIRAAFGLPVAEDPEEKGTAAPDDD